MCCFALQCGARDDLAGLYEGAQVQPVVPGQIEPEVHVGQATGQQLPFQILQALHGPCHAFWYADHTDVVPHDVL